MDLIMKSGHVLRDILQRADFSGCGRSFPLTNASSGLTAAYIAVTMTGPCRCNCRWERGTTPVSSLRIMGDTQAAHGYKFEFTTRHFHYPPAANLVSVSGRVYVIVIGCIPSCDDELSDNNLFERFTYQRKSSAVSWRWWIESAWGFADKWSCKNRVVLRFPEAISANVRFLYFKKHVWHMKIWISATNLSDIKLKI